MIIHLKLRRDIPSREKLIKNYSLPFVGKLF